MDAFLRRVAVLALLLTALLIAALTLLSLAGRPAREPAPPPGAVLVAAPAPHGLGRAEGDYRAHATGWEVRTEVEVVKVVELVGDSPSSWQEAVENAVREAAKSVPGITGVEVYNLTANVRDGRLVEYKANVKVAYVDGERR
ncbi:MAG: dodecin domain-containing protein [Clostridia bacterium]|nr:dodecin domain-containing protein [Clostridia bacterium]